MSTTTTEHMINVSDADESWAEFFPYPTVYPDQQTGINNFLDILDEGGFYSIEGACGTGKTLVGVTGAMEAMRSNDYPAYEETCVLTPNKQQLKQFVREMKGVNEALPPGEHNAKTVVMKGKGDMMPFAYTDIPPFDSESLHEHSDRLRRHARKVIRFGSDIPLDWPRDMTPPESAIFDFDWDEATEKEKERRKETNYDPIRAKAVMKTLRRKAADDDDYDTLVVDGVETPYPDVVPHTNHIVDEKALERVGRQQIKAELQGKFDPFYIGFHAEGYPSFTFRNADQSVFDRDTLFELAASEGVCPHEAMAHFGEKAEFILGNYMHLFDPQTRNLTINKMDLLDESTITILDEAHRIEGKVRDMLSDQLDIYTAEKCINDLEYTTAYLKGEYSQTPTPKLSPEDIEKVQEIVDDAKSDVEVGSDPTAEDIDEQIELFEFIQRKILEFGADYLNDELEESWQRLIDNEAADDEEEGLSSPDFPDAEDKFLRTITSRFTNGTERMKKAWPAFQFMQNLFAGLEDAGIHTRQPQDEDIGKFCSDWVTKDGIDYHRELRLSASLKDKVPAEYPPWVKGWTPKIQLYNCIPTTELRKVFSSVGAGLMMSATLSPPEAFQSAVGVDRVPKRNMLDDEKDTDSEQTTDIDAEDDDPRPSRFDQFPLRFPKENRESFVVDLPMFTSDNRGKMTPYKDSMTPERRQYADVIETICNSKGNIMICMPKYTEAAWAHDYIEGRTEKECHLDESSTDQETTNTLDRFFDDDTEGVIFTSARGTITEGVDYDGEKLHTCAVVGIPYIDTRPDRVESLKYAYSKQIGSASGFDTAIKIPAVRKARQAIGRVLRGNDEKGIRLLVDRRYGLEDHWAGAHDLLSEQEQEEFTMQDPDELESAIQSFWAAHDE